ncbi:hypothetical protein J7E71_15980 [Mesobacillus foraminis]|uniref:hypothetical protein n=1 Tax=Mesobacillus foraminis TaxID=279826 RepID=UPI001BE735AA|nr:hypothetical protein [Mesobacillus foraminis]MBT2757426.1 hypothetical protein [Mesobacillus foraminis]
MNLAAIEYLQGQEMLILSKGGNSLLIYRSLGTYIDRVLLVMHRLIGFIKKIGFQVARKEQGIALI